MTTYSELFDKFWKDFFNQFGSPFDMEKKLSGKLTQEVAEFVNGDYKTKVVCKFDESGFLVSHSAVCEKLTSDTLRTLKDQLHQYIEDENFEGAADIQKKINKIREAEQKPTL